ncbi:VENN motif pre-toxin domain-containing protein [Bacillus amyloliquefaciens]|nr:VENN motif pre-toxin domain-containing protein [Bacillus amyloliquefaciens]
MGQDALAGAAGAATGELVGMISKEMYGKSADELDETQKQTVSALATLAAGLSGGLAGDSSASAVAGAQAGKTTVENNLLGGSEDAQAAWIRQHGVDMATCSDNPAGCGRVGACYRWCCTVTWRCSGYVGTWSKCECWYQLSG